VTGKNLNLRWLATVTVFILLSAISAARRQHTTLKGQIIAYRPVEAIWQSVSHVLNQQSFLFYRPEQKSQSSAIIKLVYEHFGYSELDGDLIQRAPVLYVTARRDSSCDERYSEFLQNSPGMNDEQGQPSGIEKLVFVRSVREFNVAPERVLKCYKVAQGGFNLGR
jgi:hypothetical protein